MFKTNPSEVRQGYPSFPWANPSHIVCQCRTCGANCIDTAVPKLMASKPPLFWPSLASIVAFLGRGRGDAMAQEEGIPVGRVARGEGRSPVVAIRLQLNPVPGPHNPDSGHCGILGLTPDKQQAQIRAAP